ncbi:hypothetical protein I4F81_001637 [Pyropia yezoensis]|uniref:Uncharacterized protein n=1 Tax=Pyropia yezoensis TaxID=2788 RepID=A0ACC3BM31_PYRYE|nr:hypothetical protein I4F81_001637 [Neopyropia yezoensis]
MVDVSAKAPSIRTAVASAAVTVGPAVYALLAAGRSGGGAGGTGGKGDALVVARLAGIAAAKRTAELIPLCHTVALAHVGVELSLEREGGGVAVAATPVEGAERSGSDAGAVVAVERGMVVGEVRLEEKRGGKSGHYQRSRDGP